MPTETKTPSQMLLESQRLDEKCRNFHHIVSPTAQDLGMGTGILNNETQEIEWNHRCPDCNGTGYRWWQLRRECNHFFVEDGLSAVQLEPEECVHCSGDSFTLPPDAELAGVLLELLLDWGKDINPSKEDNWYTVYQIDPESVRELEFDRLGEGPTLNHVLVATFLKVTK